MIRFLIPSPPPPNPIAFLFIFPATSNHKCPTLDWNSERGTNPGSRTRAEPDPYPEPDPNQICNTRTFCLAHQAFPSVVSHVALGCTTSRSRTLYWPGHSWQMDIRAPARKLNNKNNCYNNNNSNNNINNNNNNNFFNNNN